MRRPMERIPSRRFLEDSSSNQFNGSSPSSSSMLAIPFPSHGPFSFLSLPPPPASPFVSSRDFNSAVSFSVVGSISCRATKTRARVARTTRRISRYRRETVAETRRTVPLEQIAFIYLVTERNDDETDLVQQPPPCFVVNICSFLGGDGCPKVCT